MCSSSSDLVNLASPSAVYPLSLHDALPILRRQRPRQDPPPFQILVPVTGRWRGLNSPASKVPSHTHGLAQTYAIDITHEPRSEEHTTELQSRGHLVCRLLLEKKNGSSLQPK